MSKEDSISWLRDATELLLMVEHIANTQGRDTRAGVPWAGMRITLESARELIEESIESLESEVDEPSAVRNEEAGALARRIQQAPTRSASGSSRVRELLNQDAPVGARVTVNE